MTQLTDKGGAYYTFQHRKVAEGKWLELDSELEPTEDEWGFSSYDSFGLRGPRDHQVQANLWLPRYDGHTYGVWSITRSQGYTDLRKANAALRHARKRNDAGAYDSRDSYNKKCQRKRYEFRLVKVTWTPDKVETVKETTVCVS
jgi:hypothetical protein